MEPGSVRESGDWAPELQRLLGEPELLLLGAVCQRAKWDAGGRKAWAPEARAFLERVWQNVCSGETAGDAVLLAMDGEG